MFDFLENILPRKKKPIVDTMGESDILNIKDLIAPSFLELNQNNLRIEERLSKSFFVFSYPQYLSSAWIYPIITLNVAMDLSFFIQPVDTGETLRKLRRKVTEVQSELTERGEKGLIRDPALEMAYRDLEDLRDQLMSAS
ncbi:MAG: conjugal transfer protein TraC, partial [Candidatus Pacebacteria bacterium]|nr:conjugal transfer protein TraC [Candidatus Paceibacterota bacterium]